MSTINKLKFKDQTTTEELLKMGFHPSDIQDFISRNILISKNDDYYQVNSFKVNQIMESKSNNYFNKIKNMIASQDISGIIDQIDRIADSEYALFSKELLKLLVKEITSMMKQIDRNSNFEYVLFSKELLDLLVEEVPGIIEKIDRTLDSEYTIFSKESLELLVKEISSMIGQIDNNPDSEYTLFSKELLKILVEAFFDHQNYSSEKEMDNGILEELWYCYQMYFQTDPILAKQYLLEYRECCKKENIPFDGNQLIRVTNKIDNFGIKKNQLTQESILKKKINQLFFEYPPDLGQLKSLINQFNFLYKKRGFYTDYYQGCYEFKLEHFEKAIKIFNQILEKDPDNLIVLEKISLVYYYLKDYYHCELCIKKYMEYNEKASVCLLLAKCYIKKSQLTKLIDFSTYLMNQNYEKFDSYFVGVKKVLEKAIAHLKKRLAYQIDENHIKYYSTKIDQFSKALEKYEELFSYVISNTSETESSIMKEYDRISHEEEIYDSFFMNDDHRIDFSGPKSYIENLDVSQDEKLLLYLSTAKILFENKFPKQASNYIKIVESEKDKSSIVKEELDIIRRNKTLYLNK